MTSSRRIIGSAYPARVSHSHKSVYAHLTFGRVYQILEERFFILLRHGGGLLLVSDCGSHNRVEELIHDLHVLLQLVLPK